MEPIPDPALIDTLLERILASEGFRRSDRQTALLRFLVTRVCQGHPEPVKEYELGIEVFGRPISYDPRTDPIVRVGMRELRTRLSRYYATEGVTDPIRIEQPKGRYCVVFTSPGPVPESEAAPPEPMPPATGKGWHRLAHVSLFLASSILIASAFAGVLGMRDDPAAGSVNLEAPAVAVLPFVNLSGDARHDYFSDGLTDELVSALMRVEGLRVTGRTSAFALKGASAAPQEIGRTLGADALLSGSVRRAGDRVRIAARLTSSQDGFELWSRTFEATIADLLSIQVDTARSVAQALRLRLDPSSGQAFIRRSNDDPRTYDLYLQARYLAQTREKDRLLESIPVFEQAITLDPGYALAHAGLADAYGVLAFNGHTEPAAAIARAREAARRALAFDPTLGEALAQLAHLAAFVDWDWALAERQFRQALELTPSHPRIHAWFGQALVVQGRFDEGLSELLVAQRLDPLAPSLTYGLGEAYLYAGRHDETQREAHRLLQDNPQSWGAHNLLARSFMAAGNQARAAAALERSHGELWADALALVALGDEKGARELIDLHRARIGTTQPFAVASLYASAGDLGQALSWLERAYAMRQVDLVSLAVDPALTPLKSEPRFQSLVRRIGLGQQLSLTAAR